MDLDEILGNSEYIVWSWPWQILGAIRAEATAGDLAEVFLSGKQHTTLPISGQPNFTKFAHKTWFCDVVNPFGLIFWKFALKESFFPKKRDHRQRFPTSSLDFSEMITNLGKSWQVGAPMECWLSIRTIVINSKSFPWTAESVRERTFLDVDGVHRHYIIIKSFAGRQHHLDVALLLSFE